MLIGTVIVITFPVIAISEDGKGLMRRPGLIRARIVELDVGGESLPGHVGDDHRIEPDVRAAGERTRLRCPAAIDAKGVERLLRRTRRMPGDGPHHGAGKDEVLPRDVRRGPDTVQLGPTRPGVRDCRSGGARFTPSPLLKSGSLLRTSETWTGMTVWSWATTR